MKNKNIVLMFGILFIFNILLISSNITAKVPDYVGIKDGDEFIWKVTYGEMKFKDFCEDFNSSYNEDVFDIEGEKIIVEDVDDDEDEFNGFDGVEVKIKNYDSEDLENDDWDEDKDFDSTVIFEFNDDLYAAYVWIARGGWLPFIATDVDWEDVADEVNDLDDYFPDLDDVNVEVESNGIIAVFEWSKDFWGDDIEDEDEIILRYNTKGVLKYYEHNYGGSLVCRMELRGGLIPGFNPIIIIGTSVTALIGIIYLYHKKIHYSFE